VFEKTVSNYIKNQFGDVPLFQGLSTICFVRDEKLPARAELFSLFRKQNPSIVPKLVTSNLLRKNNNLKDQKYYLEFWGKIKFVATGVTSKTCNTEHRVL